MNLESLLTDVRYAIRQLTEFRDCGRALDALERVEAELLVEIQDVQATAREARESLRSRSHE